MCVLSEPRPDPRIVKTKRAMCSAMLQLLDKNSFDSITVNDICNTAMISRTTFYQHFQDKYELVRFTLEQDSQRRAQTAGEDLPAVIHSLLSYVMEHRRAFQNLFVNGVNEELMRMLTVMSVTKVKRDLEAGDRAPNGVPVEIAAVFLSGGMASLMLWWVAEDFPISVENLTRHLLDMFDLQGSL